MIEEYAIRTKLKRKRFNPDDPNYLEERFNNLPILDMKSEEFIDPYKSNWQHRYYSELFNIEYDKDVIRNINKSSGYTESYGLFEPRKAIMHYTQQKSIKNVDVDDIILGNGVSELIVMAMQGLINNDDEVLIPKPDYPLWTAAVTLAGGNPVHYTCDESANWFPDINDIKSKITSKTRAILITNPNNPTGTII